MIRSTHPYEPYVPDGATKLIIGSIPPYRFCINNEKLYDKDVNFFYGSKDNHFWQLIMEVTNTTFSFENSEKAILERKKWLKDYRIGITDIIESCIHDNGHSDDKSLKEIIHRPVNKLLIKYPLIDTLICTSNFVKNELIKSLGTKYHKETSRKGFIIINDKKYHIITLYSPSPSALRGMGINGKENRKEQYTKVFNNVK